MKAAIAELERQVAEIDEARARLDQRRDKIVAVLNDLRELDGAEPERPAKKRALTVVRGGKKKPSTKAPKERPPAKAAHHPRGERVKPAKRGPGGSRSHVDEATWARARKAAETAGAQAAAEVAGVSRERIRQVAAKQGWKILKLKAGRHQAKPAPDEAKGKRRGTLGLVNQGPLGTAAHKTQRERAREQEDYPLRRCECGALTRTNPCGACGQPWSDTMKASIG